MQYQQPTVVNQQPQQKKRGGLLDVMHTLFSLTNTLFPNPVSAAGSVATGVAQSAMSGDISGAAGQIAQAVGENDKNPSDTSKPQIQNTPPNQPTSTDNPKTIGPSSSSKQAQMAPGQVQTKDIQLNSDSQTNNQQNNQSLNPFDSYNSKTLDEIYLLHPELQGMFPLLVQQLPSFGGQRNG